MDTQVHREEPHYGNRTVDSFSTPVRKDLAGNPEPNPYPTCSYCGSLDVASALRAFQTPGTRWSGSDWKYGWPHKFYIDVKVPEFEAVKGSTTKDGVKTLHPPSKCSTVHYKFYSSHLSEATPDQMAAWDLIVAPITGVQFILEGEGAEAKLKWRAVPGHQGWGTIQEDGSSKRENFALPQ